MGLLKNFFDKKNNSGSNLQTLSLEETCQIEVIHEAFLNMHAKILKDADLPILQRNVIEKNLLLDLLNKAFEKREKELEKANKRELEKIKKELLRQMDKWWEEKEPDRKIGLI